MKSEFKARPVFLSREDRIKAHFTTCFLALVIFRYLEKRLNEQYTSSQIIETLKEYEFREFKGFGYVPIYTYTDMVENLHKVFNFDTSKEIIEHKNLKKIINQTKK